MATIRYFLPEDGDSEETPNVFLAPKPSRPGYPPALGQIKNSFPLPGNYHFRFKTALVPGTDRDKNAVAVWMDCLDDSEPVPVWQGSIIAKVTRTGVDDEEEYDEDFADRSISRAESNVSNSGYSAVSSASAHSSNQQKVEAPAVSTHSTDSLLGAFDDPPAPAAPAAPAASASTHSSTGNLLDVDHAPAPVSGGSLLDMDGLGSGGGYHRSGADTPNSDHAELLNMSAPMPSQTHAPSPQGMSTQAQYQQQQQQQQAMQRQQPPMHGQYPMQYPPQGQYGQQGMGQMGVQQQQQQPRGQPTRPGSANNGNKNAFDSFSSNTLDPLGSLKWG